MSQKGVNLDMHMLIVGQAIQGLQPLSPINWSRQNGLQIRLRRFDSDLGLHHSKAPQPLRLRGFFVPADFVPAPGLGQFWDTDGNCVSQMSPAKSGAWLLSNSAQAAHGG